MEADADAAQQRQRRNNDDSKRDAADNVKPAAAVSSESCSDSSTGAPKVQALATPTKAAATLPVAAASPSFAPQIRGGGRIRLPDKLMEYLSKEVLPDTLWWQPDGDGFAFDTEKIQPNFLDKHFRGTKLTSFIRSLNRWGFRRIFYHSLPKSALSFHHPLF